MPKEGATEGHRHFASDLRRIRESYGISVDDLHESTKIPRGLIEEFEETALVGHPMFNRVYLRSLARAYAGELDLSPGFTLRALEQAQEGEYEGGLADEYIEPEQAEATPAEETENDQKEAASQETPDAEQQEAASTDKAESHQIAHAQEEKTLPSSRASSEEKSRAEETGAASASAAGTAASQSEAPESASERSDRASRGRSRSHRSKRKSGAPNWVYGIGLLVVLGVGIGLYFLFSSGGATEPPSSSGAAATRDTSSLRTSQTTASTAPVEPVQIGDSLNFRVTAARGPVRELRVKPDDELRRPYWIEEGDSQVFRAQGKIIFQNAIENKSLKPLNNISLQLEGKTYPTDRRDAQGRIVVTRQSAQSYLDSLARAQS